MSNDPMTGEASGVEIGSVRSDLAAAVELYGTDRLLECVQSFQDPEV